MYQQIIRPLMFLLDPERAHDVMVRMLRVYGKIPFLRTRIRNRFRTDSKPRILNDLRFRNRIGLSAGFDKNGEIFDELADFGFGFLEIGTVTVHPQKGNPKPRIFRLVKDDSLISRTGFNNCGLKRLKENIRRRHTSYLFGVNINKDPLSEGSDIVADFLYLFESLYDSVDYFTLNWGSVPAGPFSAILSSLTDYRTMMSTKRPLFIKLPADIAEDILDEVLSMASRYDIDGFVATGPTMDRSMLVHYTEKELQQIGVGGVSGKGIGNKSEEVVRYIRAHEQKRFTIIGAGGVMTPADARNMITAGADLVQIYSAFIYSGPEIIRLIKQEID